MVIKYLNKPLLYTLAFLITFGLLMLFSTSIAHSNEMYGQCQKLQNNQFVEMMMVEYDGKKRKVNHKECQKLQNEQKITEASLHYHWESKPYYIISKQLIYLGLSFLFVAIVLRIPIITLERLSIPLFFFTLILLVLVFMPIIGVEVKGAHR